VKEHDDFAIGIYKNIENAETLVGHLPMELSFLLCKYLEAKKDCGLTFSPTGQRLLEDGLVVPGKYVVKGVDHYKIEKPQFASDGGEFW